MNPLLVCTIITVCIVYVYDVVEFPTNFIRNFVSKVFNREIYSVKVPKLLKCSLCATTWVTFIVLLILLPQYFYLALLFGYLTKFILYIIQTIDNIVSIIFIAIDALLTKMKKLILNI